MATFGTYYSNCSIITSGGSCYLYTDPGLSIPAPNGWYVFNGVCYRVQGPGGSTTGLVISLQQCTLPTTTTTSGGCLVYGTLITMADGSIKQVQDVVAGDKLLSLTDSESFYADGTFELAESVVTELNKFEEEKIVDINDGELVSSIYHIHVVKSGEGWTTMKADLLVVGDILIDINGEEFEITSLEIKDEPQTVYQISLDTQHLYFANEILTHNIKQSYICCATYPGDPTCIQVNSTSHPTWTCENWGYYGPCTPVGGGSPIGCLSNEPGGGGITP